MTPTETHVDSAPRPQVTLEVLHQGYQSLRMALNVVLVMLILLTGGLNIFLLKQVKLARRQVMEARTYIANYQQNSEPLIDNFVGQLQAFTKSNPDFAPVLAKYFKLLNPAESSETPLALPPANKK